MNEFQPTLKKYTIILLILLIGSMFIYPILALNFPDNGKFTRDVWFIKPTTSEIPYFVMYDDIETGTDNLVEWIQHGRDKIDINENEQSWNFSTIDYLKGNQTSLYGRIITPNIELESGISYTSITKDQKAPYILAKTQGSQQLCTILIPLNESIRLPEIKIIQTSKEKCCFAINHNQTNLEDIFWMRDISQTEEMDIQYNNWNPTAERIFIRVNRMINETFNTSIQNMAFVNALELFYQNQIYLNSNHQISGSLTFSDHAIDGTIETTQTTLIKIRTKNPTKLIINQNQLLSNQYSYEGGLLTFTLEGANTYTLGGQFVNYGQVASEEYPKTIDSKKLEELEEKSHPFLLFDQNQTDQIIHRLNAENPIKSFYQKLKEKIAPIEESIFNSGFISSSKISRHTFKESFYLWGLEVLEGNETALNYIKQSLDILSKYVFDAAKHGIDLAQTAIAASIAYDLAYNNCTINERTRFENNLKFLIKGNVDGYDLVPLNNHLGVDMGAVGVVGLVTKDNSLIDLAVEQMNLFFKEEFHDGIPIESFIIASHGVKDALPFTYAATRLEFINYFQEGSELDSFLERYINIQSPIGVYPNYEDSLYHYTGVLDIRLAGHLTNNERLREEISYFYEINKDSNYFQNEESFSGDFDSEFLPLELFVWRDLATPVSPSINKTAWVSYKGGNAALRTSWNPNAVFISMNAKTYRQSHTQLNELSYEIYAYGALLSMNLGFPGWKNENHSTTVSTFGSNSVRLNDQDQLREISNGFQFHLFSPSCDIIQMDAGNLYQSFYNWNENPILYVVLMFIQILISILVFISYFIFKNTEERSLPQKSWKINSYNLLHPQYGKNSTKNIEDNSLLNLKKLKIIIFSLFYITILLRIFFFTYSIFRKLNQWYYSRDSTLYLIIFVALLSVIIIIPFIGAILFYKINQKFKKTLISGNLSSIFYERLKKILPIVLFGNLGILIAIFYRERTLINLISREFGAIVRFANEFISWGIFNIWILLGFSIISILIYGLVFHKLCDREIYILFILRISMIWIGIFLIWYIFILSGYSYLMTLTIETWFG